MNDQAAFKFLLDTFWNDVYGFQLKRTENENDAEDDSSDFVIAIKRDVSLDGGVTNEFVKRTIEVWVDMLLSTQGFFEGPTVEVIDGDEP